MEKQLEINLIYRMYKKDDSFFNFFFTVNSFVKCSFDLVHSDDDDNTFGLQIWLHLMT